MRNVMLDLLPIPYVGSLPLMVFEGGGYSGFVLPNTALGARISQRVLLEIEVAASLPYLRRELAYALRKELSCRS